MNEFISSPIDLLQSLGAASNRCIAAIAYVTKDWLDFGDEDLLICDASDAAICARRTDRRLLSELVDRGVQVYSKTPLVHGRPD